MVSLSVEDACLDMANLDCSISIGMDEYLTKPLRKPDLLSMLDKVVNARRMAAMPSARGIGSYTTTHAP